jgi:DNA-binding LacI/PurR family transcriptional regulator
MDSLCDAYFFDLISGMQNRAEELDYNIIFCSGSNDSKIKSKYVDYFAHGRADGLIAFGSRFHDLFHEIIKKAKHFVIIEGDIPNLNFNKVQINNFKGSYNATKHLIDLGYKNIIHFTGDMNYSVSEERLNGYLQAMQDHNLSTENAIIYSDFGEELAYQKMLELIGNQGVPEACFAGADKPAYGIIRALNENGLKTPDDMALIGFDDDKPDSRDIVFPKLTTLRQPLFAIGKAAVTLLVNSINNPDAPFETIILDAEFIQGETCR